VNVVLNGPLCATRNADAALTANAVRRNRDAFTGLSVQSGLPRIAEDSGTAPAFQLDILRSQLRLHPRASTSRATRSRISSRIRRTSSSGRPFGSESGQSSRIKPGMYGHASPQPIVTRSDAARASSSVSLRGLLPLRSMPISRMTCTTSGWTRSPGSVPAEMASADDGSTIVEKKAAAICERPALWTQAKITRSIYSATCN